MGATDSLRFRFEERRAVQACAVLLRKAGGRDNYTKVLKELYLADRQSLLETGCTITGSTFVNMANGPVLSEVYECIKDDSADGFWDLHIRTEGYEIELLEDPGDDALSDYDVSLLTGLAQEHAGRDYSAMITLVHRLPEWKSPKPNKVASLPVADVLRAAGEDEATIDQQAQRVAYLAEVDASIHSS